MIEVGTIDIPALVTAILAIVMAAGGVVGRSTIKRTLEGLVFAASALYDIADLLVLISEAGEDGELSPDEWARINEKADKLKAKAHLVQSWFS